VLLYSVAGGMWSISFTDIIQFVVMTVGIFFLLLPLSISAAGGLGAMGENLPGSYFDITAIGDQTILAYFLAFFLGIMIGQETWQRVFTARSGGVARWGGLLTGVYCVLYALPGRSLGAPPGSSCLTWRTRTTPSPRSRRPCCLPASGVWCSQRRSRR
jgi:SSS family solute:Na+ symporter